MNHLDQVKDANPLMVFQVIARRKLFSTDVTLKVFSFVLSSNVTPQVGRRSSSKSAMDTEEPTT